MATISPTTTTPLIAATSSQQEWLQARNSNEGDINSVRRQRSHLEKQVLGLRLANCPQAELHKYKLNHDSLGTQEIAAYENRRPISCPTPSSATLLHSSVCKSRMSHACFRR